MKYPRVIGYSEASFVSLTHFSAWLGHFFSVGDGRESVVHISFKFDKAKRVTRFAIFDAVVASSDLIDSSAVLPLSLK